ncbi:gamma-glutamyltransferase [Actinomycetota bacterium]
MGTQRIALVGALAGSLTVALTLPATAAVEMKKPDRQGSPVGHQLPKVPVMRGAGGAVSSVDPVASQVGIDVLEQGGNATDAAIATAAALGVTEPYSAGIGGGGFFVHYDADTGKVETVDGRETAPQSYDEDVFRNPDGTAMDFITVVNSGMSVGVPGTPATWQVAADAWGTKPLGSLLKPAETIANKGFVVDQTFHDQTADNAERFAMFPATADVYLPGGAPPAVGSVFRNKGMAKAYRELRTHGVESMYSGRLARAVVDTVHDPGADVMAGELTMADLADYEALRKAPTHSQFRGLDVYGMGLPSSGGIAVSEILNLMEAYEKRTGAKVSDLSEADYLHWFSEASATAFADRNRYVGDVPGVPVGELLSQGFAAERSCLFDPERAHPRPIPFGTPDGDYADCGEAAGTTGLPADGQSTTSLSVADKWGNVVSYTLTIEQTGGSGITVPGYGFLLNNELTDFNFVPVTAGVPDPNLPGPGKRPRSSMSPTILVEDGRPYLAVGSPGGATIITTVSQIILGYVDRGLPLVDAVAAPRLSSRNGSEGAEPVIADGPIGAELKAMGHTLSRVREIGAGVAIRTHSPTDLEAAAETTRRGGGSAMVVDPR